MMMCGGRPCSESGGGLMTWMICQDCGESDDNVSRRYPPPSTVLLCDTCWREREKHIPPERLEQLSEEWAMYYAERPDAGDEG